MKREEIQRELLQYLDDNGGLVVLEAKNDYEKDIDDWLVVRPLDYNATVRLSVLTDYLMTKIKEE